MRPVHLLRVEDDPSAFGVLVAAATAAGHRVGWLDLVAAGEAPEDLARAIANGALRAVRVTGSGYVAAKAVPGGLVVRDLLREQFLGCRLVLVRGEMDAPRLETAAGGWRIASESVAVDLSTEDLVARLARPARTFLND